LSQDPFAYTTLAVIVTRAKSGIVARLLQCIVQISVYEEFDPCFDGDLVAADSPIDLGLLTRVESIDVDVCPVATAKSFPQRGFIGEGSLED